MDSLFIVAPFVLGSSAFGSDFIMQCIVTFLFCNQIDGEDRAGCFTLIVFHGVL